MSSFDKLLTFHFETAFAKFNCGFILAFQSLVVAASSKSVQSVMLQMYYLLCKYVLLVVLADFKQVNIE